MRDLPTLRREWENRLPSLDGEWSHWRLEGDGSLFGLVPAARIGEALRLIEENFERFSRIKAFRARASADGNCVARENMFFVITDATLANLPVDEDESAP